MSGNFSRDKGQRAEREFIAILQPIVERVMGVETKLKRNLMQTQDGGFDVEGLEWLALEIKMQETLAVENWWQQTLKQATGGRLPVLAYRKSRVAWRIRMMGSLSVGFQHDSKVVQVCPVDIKLDDFLQFFELKLHARKPFIE